MNRPQRVLAAAGLLLLGVLAAEGWPGPGLQDTPQASIEPAAADGIQNPAASRPAKERMAAYVLLGWVWLSIAVLLGFLRMRVREADRVHRMGLVRAGEGPPGGPEH